MNVKVLATLAVLTIFALPIFAVSASTGQSAIPIWTDCRGAHPHGNVEIGGAIGQSSVVVSWTSPGSDWISDLGCHPYPFTQTDMTVYVNSPGISPVPTTVVCHSTSCADGFALLQTKQYCVGHTCTGETVPYKLRYSDSIVVEVTATYAGYENHFGILFNASNILSSQLG